MRSAHHDAPLPGSGLNSRPATDPEAGEDGALARWAFRAVAAIVIAGVGLLLVRGLNGGPASGETALVAPPPLVRTADLQPASTAETGAARAAVMDWAEAIENREHAHLMARYEPGYHGFEAADRPAFEARWKELLRTADWLAVDLDALVVARTPSGELVATFPMELRTSGPLVVGRRQLWFTEHKGQLRIDDDRWVGW